MLIRTGKQRFFATLFLCGILIWGVGRAFVELRDPGSGNDRWRIDHVTDAGTGSNEEAFQILDIDGVSTPRLNLYLDNGRLGASQFCALDGTSCSTAAAIATAVAGYVGGDGLTLTGDTFSVNVDDASIEISGDTLQLKDLGVTTGKINDLAVTLGKLAANSVNSSKIVNDTILFEDLTGGLTLTAAEDVGDNLAGGFDNVIPTTDAVVGYVTAYVAANGDDLGDHTATTDLVMGTNAITGTTGNIDYTNFDVVGASGNTTIGGTLNIAGVTQLGLDGTDGSLVIYSDDAGGDFTYTIQPGVATQNVVLTLPVDDGDVSQVLQTDGNGVLTWVDQAGSDDLGDHTATQDLDLADNDLIGTTAGINFNNFDVVGASGNTTIGGTLGVTGNTTLSTLDVTSTAGIDGNFDVNTTAFTVIAASGNTTVGGTLDVTGDLDVNSNFTVTAASGNTDIGGTLDVTGALTAASIDLGSTTVVSSILDDDAFTADSATALATQQSIKAYVDAQVGDDLGNHIATQDLNMNGNWIGGDGDGTEGIFVDIDGEVGIGTNDPSAALEVNGQILASGTITSSDLRLKENIQPLQNSLEKIRQVQTYTYTWKDKQRGEGIQFGVIAQEMEEVYPDLVHTFDDGYKAVNYQALVAPLIDAVQELSDRVEALEAENQALKKAVSQQ